jgi:hypothetical protein
MAMSCGYGAASLTERIYGWAASPQREAAAGLLICTTASDSEGTLGGLVALSETERKARNLSQNANCILTTGRNDLEDGLDVVAEGEAAVVTDDSELGRVAGVFETKYGSRFTAPGGTWFGLGDEIRTGGAVLYRVAPSTVFGFGKGVKYSQTRWRFSSV